MRASVLAAAVVALLAWAGLAAGSARPAEPLLARSAAETIDVTQGSPAVSATVLVASHKYQLDVSGTVSYWCTSNDPSSCFWPEPQPPPAPPHPSVELAGVDALYCYATWRCPTPQLWRPLQVNGVGLDQFAGEEGKIPYNGGNTYTVTVTGVSGPLSFVDTASTPTGSFTVTITDLAAGGGCSHARAPAAAGRAASVARIVSIRSADPNNVDVEIVHADGTTCEAKPGDELAESDRIRTGYKNEATIDFGGKATVVLEEMSEINVALFTIAEVTDVELWLKSGGVGAQVNKEAGASTKFRVKTATLTASVRGTAFSVSYDPATRVSIVDVSKDTVDVLPTKGLSANPPRSGLPEVTVPAGKEVLVGATRETPLAPIGYAGVPAGDLARPAAIGLVEGFLNTRMHSCQLKVNAVTAQPAATSWRVSANVISKSGSGWATYTLTHKPAAPKNRYTLTFNNKLAANIIRSCP